MRRLLLPALLATAHGLSAQAPPCAIVDAASGAGVPFANVYVPTLGTGAVSNSAGVVRLSPKLRDAPPGTLATVSCIGYADAAITLRQLTATTESCGVALAPQPYALPGAEVSARAYGDDVRRLGFRKVTSNVRSGYGSGGDGIIGAEVGNLMRARGGWWLQTVGLNVHVDTATLVEVNVYAVEDGQPTARLNPERVLVNLPDCRSREHEIPVDLAERHIAGTGPFLVTVEPLSVGLEGPGETDPRLVDPREPALATLTDTLSARANPMFNSKIALLGKRRITRYRARDGKWKRAPLGLLVGVWADVREED